MCCRFIKGNSNVGTLEKSLGGNGRESSSSEGLVCLHPKVKSQSWVLQAKGTAGAAHPGQEKTLLPKNNWIVRVPGVIVKSWRKKHIEGGRFHSTPEVSLQVTFCASFMVILLSPLILTSLFLPFLLLFLPSFLPYSPHLIVLPGYVNGFRPAISSTFRRTIPLR